MIIAITKRYAQFNRNREDTSTVTVGWIIYNGFLTSNSFHDYAQMIQEAAISRSHDACLYKNNEIVSVLNEKINIFTSNKNDLPDYVVFTDKDTYLARQFELMNIPVFNSAATIEVSDDKIKTYQILAANDIKIPQTIFAPKTFGLNEKFDTKYLQFVIGKFGFPLILKEAFGSFGEQVYFIENIEQLQMQISKVKNNPFMFQQFIQTSFGVDLRLQVVGDEVITAMKRSSVTDFRANVTSGGKMERYDPTKTEKEIAVRASHAIGADFSGVDLLFGDDNKPIVCEVNSNAHIRNLLDCTGVNVAFHMIQHIEKKLGVHLK